MALLQHTSLAWFNGSGTRFSKVTQTVVIPLHLILSLRSYFQIERGSFEFSPESAINDRFMFLQSLATESRGICWKTNLFPQ